ncbi:MAG: hypothetical protein ABJB12_09225 [Pseudomonadota bacterium]
MRRFGIVLVFAGWAPLGFSCSRNEPADDNSRGQAAASAHAQASPLSLPSPPAQVEAPIPTPAASATSTPAASAKLVVAPGIEAACAKICSHSQELKCTHAEQCAQNCLAMASLTPCSRAFQELFACLGKEPPAHWECDDDGVAAIREGYCEKEQASTTKCLEAKLEK